MPPHPLRPAALLLLVAAIPLACAGREAPAAQPEAQPPGHLSGDSGVTAAGQRDPHLSPLGDSIAQALVFVPRNQTWFTAAARGKRMLLDLGRVDIEVRRDSTRARVYRSLVQDRAPVAAGTRLRLHGPWGSDDVSVAGFDTWNGRIVAVLDAPPHVDSIAERVEPLPASAVRALEPGDSAPASCVRDTFDLAHAQRLDALRDSLEQSLRASSASEVPYERLLSSVTVKTTVAHGCFATGRTILVASLRAGSFEFARERVVLVAENGRVTPLRIVDSRWRAHDVIYALDADGDGADDVAMRGSSDRAGGTVIFRVNGSRLERLTGGFNWETR